MINSKEKDLAFKFDKKNMFSRKVLKREDYFLNIFYGFILTVFLTFFIVIRFSVENLEAKILYVIFIFGLFLVIQITSITLSLNLTSTKIEYTTLFPSTKKYINFEDVLHFCFFETPIERGGFSNNLLIYLKPKKFAQKRTTSIRLNFTAEENFKVLSSLYRRGYKVLLYDLYLNIEESEFYIPIDVKDNLE